MPWSVKKDGTRFCVHDKDGKQLKCYPDKVKADNYVKALYAAEAKLETDTAILLEGTGPVLTYVAVTSKPHLDQRQPGGEAKRIQVLEIDGKKLVKIPMYRKGLYLHDKYGPLNFNQAFTDKLISNHNARQSRTPVYLDFRHGDQYGSLAYLDVQDGGRIEEEQDGWVYVYGVPTRDDIDQIVKQWPHASIEVDPNHKTNAVKYFSSENLQSIHLEQLVEDDVMPKTLKFGDVTISLEEDEGGFSLGKDTVSELEKVVKEYARLVKLDADIKEKDQSISDLETQKSEVEKSVKDLETQLNDAKSRLERLRKGEPEAPEAPLPREVQEKLEALEAQNKILLEARAEQEAARLREQVAFTLKSARDKIGEDGYGYAKPFLDVAEKALLLESIEEGDKAIKLEQGDKADSSKLIAYYRNAIRLMLETGVSRVPRQAKTWPIDDPLSSNGRTYTDEELKVALEEFKTFDGYYKED